LVSISFFLICLFVSLLLCAAFLIICLSVCSNCFSHWLFIWSSILLNLPTCLCFSVYLSVCLHSFRDFFHPFFTESFLHQFDAIKWGSRLWNWRQSSTNFFIQNDPSDRWHQLFHIIKYNQSLIHFVKLLISAKNFKSFPSWNSLILWNKLERQVPELKLFE